VCSSVLQQCVAAVRCSSVLQQCVAAVCCELRSCEKAQVLERSVLQCVAAVCCSTVLQTEELRVCVAAVCRSGVLLKWVAN